MCVEENCVGHFFSIAITKYDNNILFFYIFLLVIEIIFILIYTVVPPFYGVLIKKKQKFKRNLGLYTSIKFIFYFCSENSIIVLFTDNRTDTYTKSYEVIFFIKKDTFYRP